MLECKHIYTQMDSNIKLFVMTGVPSERYRRQDKYVECMHIDTPMDLNIKRLVGTGIQI